MTTINGRCFVFGDNIDTDALAPGQYIKGPIEELARHCLESADAGFAASVKAGDIVVAGRNFGMGSSREQAAQALRVLGVGGVVAVSFGGIFFRNAINLGLPVFVAADATQLKENTQPGDRLALDAAAATLHNLTENTVIDLQPLPDFLLDMLSAGGLVAVLEKRFGVQHADAAGQTSNQQES